MKKIRLPYYLENLLLDDNQVYNKILILGDRKNLFGHFNKEIINLCKFKEYDFSHLKFLGKQIINGSEFTIICNDDNAEYYKYLFDYIKKMNNELNIKYNIVNYKDNKDIYFSYKNNSDFLNSFDLVMYEQKNKRKKINIKRRKYNINAGEIIICKYNNYKCIIVDNNNSIKIKSIDERLNDDNIYSLSGFCAKYIKTNRERANFHGANWFTYNKLPLKNFMIN